MRKARARAVEESICEAEACSADADKKNTVDPSSPKKRKSRSKSRESEGPDDKNIKALKISPQCTIKNLSQPESSKVASPPLVQDPAPTNVPSLPIAPPPPPLPPPLPVSEESNKAKSTEPILIAKKLVPESPPKSPNTFFTGERDQIKFKERGPLSRKIGVLLKSPLGRSPLESITKASQDSDSYRPPSSIEQRIQNSLSTPAKESLAFRPFSANPLKNVNNNIQTITQNGGKITSNDRNSPAGNRYK